MRHHFFPLAFVMALTGCAESIDHDAVSAARRAEEFAQVAFVKHDIEKGYALLSESTRRYVSLEQFKEVLSRLHPQAFPISVTASEYEPMPGEKAMYIFLTGKNSGERFYYRLTMEGTATTGYRVLSLDRGSGPYSQSSRKEKLGESAGRTSAILKTPQRGDAGGRRADADLAQILGRTGFSNGYGGRTDSLLYGFTQGGQKHNALSRAMGREKIRDVIIEECEPRGPQPLGVG